ncbi:MAG: sugar-binding protein [Armatimonadota bacterium]|nr:sugar-binding protein [Armatimonadota bacterium]
MGKLCLFVVAVGLVGWVCAAPAAVAGPHDDVIWRIFANFDNYPQMELQDASQGVWGTDYRPNQMMLIGTYYYSSPNCVRMQTQRKDGWFGYDPENGYMPSTGIIYFHFRVKSPTRVGTTQCFKSNLTSMANQQEFGGNPFGEWLGDETRLRPHVGGQFGPYQSLMDGNWHECDIKHVVSTKTTTWYWDGVQIWQLDLDGPGGIPDLPNNTVQKAQFEAMPNDNGYSLLIDDVGLGSNVASLGPGPVSDVIATPGNGKITLSWRNPPDASFTGTIIRWGDWYWPADWMSGNPVVDKAGSPNAAETYTVTGLTNGVIYRYSLMAHDSSGHYSVRVGTSGVPAVVTLGSVRSFTVSKGTGQNNLSWRNPSDSAFTGTLIRYKTTGYPTGPTDGTLLVNQLNSPDTNDSCVHSGVSGGATYYYAAYAHDSLPMYGYPAYSSTLDPTAGYFRLHPDNPHYFQEANTGKPVMLGGFQSIVPSDTSYDYVNDPDGINQLLSRRVEYSRVWHFLPWALSNAVWPWARSGTPGAPMGGNKIDMNTWNSTYWTRMRDAMSRANTGGTYAEIHLFDRCGMSPAGPDRWQGNPWASDNNVNGLETPVASSDGTPEFYGYASRPNLRNQQERYVRKMIDETIGYPNVFYEIENEHWDAPSAGWADHYAQFVKDYITANYPASPRLVSYSSIESEADLDTCYSMPALSIVNKHWGSEPETDPSIVNTYLEQRWSYNKAVNVDEFANGLTNPDALRQICWTAITSGGNFHIEDAQPAANPYDVCENIRAFKALSGWDFIHGHPDKSLITAGGGYCMAQNGVEYVCYFPTGGSMTVSLSAGNYRAEWWNPRTGGFYNVSNFAHTGGGRILDSPDASDWVLHLAIQANPTTVLESKFGGTITVDGNSSDWNLAQFTTRIGGGDVGTGQIAVVGYDTNGVCYSGNHASGMQFPPANAADHAAKIYSRHDAAYLYFLIRCDDNDMRYSSPVESNWANDCVEIYIDPGHDHGWSSVADSTSDIQLVIDANNQRNVYMTTPGYATQILNNLTSAVVRDATGWWLEARLAKSALDPDVPGTGAIGIDFNFRDNDNNNDSALTTVYTWTESSNDGFPSKVPDRWGDLDLMVLPDETPPGPVTGFAAVGQTGQVSLSWTNPSDSDFTGTLIRYKTGGYPANEMDGTLVIDKPGSPGAADNHIHTGLAGGVTYYYSAFAHDVVPNYSTKADASATTLIDTIPPGPVTGFSAAGGNAQVVLSWTNPSDSDFDGALIRYKTGGYPADRTDGALVIDKAGSPGAGGSHTQTGLINGTTYYYSAWGHDSSGNYSTNKADATGAPNGAVVCTLNVKKAGVITVNGSSSDWNLSEFTTKVRGGENVLGDMGIVGFDGGTVYYGGRWTGGVLPTSPTDHTARIYSRHDTNNVYLLMRVDDSDMQYSSPVDSNWNNDCVEIYIDPSHDHGSSPMSSSTSDIQFVIDANGQKNIYACTDTYKTQILAGLTSVVLRDSSGWWLEMRLSKSALDPDIPPLGSIGIDFCFRDNDNTNDSAQTTVYSWRDNASGATYPTKVPDRWGDAIMADVTAPAAVTGFAAVPGDQQISLSWTNPSDSDFIGTLLRYKTGSYPISVTDGTLAVDKPGSPGSAGSHIQTGLTNGTRYYFSAWARDGLNNYSSKVNANAIPVDTGPPGSVTAFGVIVGNERNNLSWTNPADADLVGVKVLAKTTGYPTSQTDGTVVYDGVATSCVHEALTNGTMHYYCAYAYDEVPSYSTAAQADGVPMRYDSLDAKLEPNDTEATITVGVVTCTWSGGFYIQCPDGSGALGGIRVDMAAHGLSAGQSAGAKGMVGTDPLTDEKRVTAMWAKSNTSVYTASPVAISGSTLGGSDLSYNPVTGAGQKGIVGASGPNNIGLLVRVFGRVTQRQTSDPKYFYVDDGSGLKDGTLTGGIENEGVRVAADPASWAEGSYVVVTGVSSCFKDGGALKRQVAPVAGGIESLGL